MANIKPDYTGGTVSLAVGGTVVTGVGTLWETVKIVPGATFKVQNLDAIILSVDSNTQITLKEPWTGDALPAGSSYAIRFQPDGSSLAAATRDLIELLGNGNAYSLSELDGDVDKFPIFDAPNSMTIISRKEISNFLSLESYGAVGDGLSTTDNTAAIQDCINAAAIKGLSVWIPKGTFFTGNLTFAEGARFKGQGETQSKLKALSGATGTLVNSAGNTNDVHFEHFAIDGNYPANPVCDTLRINGSRPTVKNITLVNNAGRGLVTTYTPNDRVYSILGHFSHITIDKARTTGWDNQGPNDSYVAHVEIVDASQGLDAGYYGYFSSGPGTIRGFDLHTWNRTTGAPVPRPAAGAYLNNGGNIITGSHFESGTTSMVVNGGNNILLGNSWYAPDGNAAIRVLSSFNEISGLVGGGADLFYPDFIGLVLGNDPTILSEGNIIDLLDGGCNLGAIDLTYSGGKNQISVRGYKASGKPSWIGNPKSNDNVNILTSGPGAATLVSPASISWGSYNPVITASSGTITTKSATGKFRREGSTCHFQSIATITTNGSGAGVLRVSLPIAPVGSEAISAINANTLATLSAVTNAAGYVSIATSGPTYPAAVDGTVIIVSGSYEVA